MSNITYSENEIPNLSVTLTDGATNMYPLGYVYNYDKTLKETVTLVHNANGEYIGTTASAYTHNSYTVVYKVFSDSGHTTLNSDYWITEDNLYVAYQPTWGGSGSSGNTTIVFDMKKMAEEIWSHSFPKKMMEILEFIKDKVIKIKDIVAKITDSKVLQAIKGIVFPKIPPYPEFPKFPEFPEIPEMVDITPLENSLDEVNTKLKTLEKSVNGIDYGATLSEVVRLIESNDRKEQQREKDMAQKEMRKHEAEMEELKKLIK